MSVLNATIILVDGRPNHQTRCVRKGFVSLQENWREDGIESTEFVFERIKVCDAVHKYVLSRVRVSLTSLLKLILFKFSPVSSLKC